MVLVRWYWPLASSPKPSNSDNAPRMVSAVAIIDSTAYEYDMFDQYLFEYFLEGVDTRVEPVA